MPKRKSQRQRPPVSQGPAKTILIACTAVLLLGVAALWLRANRPGRSAAGPLADAPRPKEVTFPAAPPPVSTASNAPTDVLTENSGTDVDKATECLKRGNDLLAAGKVEEAIEQYKRAAKLNPEDEDIYYNLGLAFARVGNLAEAKQAYNEALKIYPDYVEALNNLGNLLVKEGSYDEAVQQLSRAVELDPKSSAAQNSLGNALARLGRYGEALLHFQKALEGKPDYLEAQQNLASAYLMLGRSDEATKEFTSILKNHPDFEPARKGLARAVRDQSQKK